MNERSPRERRLIAFAILVAVIAVVWLALIAPILAGFEARALEREESRIAYARNDRIIATMRVWRGVARRQRADAARYAIVAATPALAVDALREQVLAVARARGATVSSAQETPGGDGFIAMRVEMTVPMARFDAVFAALQNGAPPLVIERLTIGADRALLLARAEPVDVRIEVAALYAPAPDASAADAAR